MPSLEALSPRKQLVVFAILAVMLVGVAEYTWLSGIGQANDAILAKVNTLRLNNAQLEPLETRLPAMQHQVAVLQQQLVGLEQVVPPRTRTGRFLQEIESTARASGVYIREVTAQPPNHHSFYVAVPYSLALDGSYRQLADFYARLAKMRRIVNVENIDLEHLNRASGLAYQARETVSAGCQIITFYSRQGAAPVLRRP